MPRITKVVVFQVNIQSTDKEEIQNELESFEEYVSNLTDNTNGHTPYEATESETIG